MYSRHMTERLNVSAIASSCAAGLVLFVGQLIALYVSVFDLATQRDHLALDIVLLVLFGLPLLRGK